MPEIPDQPTQDHPYQPDGIDSDSRDLPDPVRAAERVRTYIAAMGDGLYDAEAGAPLYARDLEVIARIALSASQDRESAYRAGREDLMRSESCPECEAGERHHEPEKPHIHLTPYGYLVSAPNHEQIDFIRQIREIERRAGREDATRTLQELADAAIAWRAQFEKPADSKPPRMAALIKAVDRLINGQSGEDQDTPEDQT